MIETVTRHLVKGGELQERLDRGQQFSAYESATKGVSLIGIGPVTDFTMFAKATSIEGADLIVDALRSSFGQAPALCTMREKEDRASREPVLSWRSVRSFLAGPLPPMIIMFVCIVVIEIIT